jgi:hypothetical protein
VVERTLESQLYQIIGIMRIPRQGAREASQFRQQFDDPALKQIVGAHLSSTIRLNAIISSIGFAKKVAPRTTPMRLVRTLPAMLASLQRSTAR